jgi:hypothetical protein
VARNVYARRAHRLLAKGAVVLDVRVNGKSCSDRARLRKSQPGEVAVFCVDRLAIR